MLARLYPKLLGVSQIGVLIKVLSAVKVPDPTCKIVLSALKKSSPTTKILNVLLAIVSPSLTLTVNSKYLLSFLGDLVGVLVSYVTLS